jgi:SAM-dependent methyltransferase
MNDQDRPENSSPPSLAAGSPERFGYSWDMFDDIIEIYEEQFDGWVSALPEECWQGAHFLDVGCGIGRNSLWAKKRGTGSGVAIDVDDRTLSVAKRNLANTQDMTVQWMSAYDIEFENRFDIVFSLGVIHHLDEPERAVERMTRAAKPGGHVLVWLYGRENNGWIVALFEPFTLSATY